METPKHGAERNHRIASSKGHFTGVLDNGEQVSFKYDQGGTSVCERYCRVHGWVRVHGVVGMLEWMALHEDC